jgi:hypothetical protein
MPPLSLWIHQFQQVSRFINQSVPVACGSGTVLFRLEGTWLVVWSDHRHPTGTKRSNGGISTFLGFGREVGDGSGLWD